MNKGNLNKLVTNYPVELTEEEIANLSGTLAPVIAACGGGGGGTGGKIYTGIGFVTVNNTTNQIGLTNEANTKLNQDIPTKVSDLSDSANYQTVAGMDEYLTSANAQTLYQTKDDMSAYLTSANASSTYQTIAGMDEYATKDWTNNNFISEQELAGSVVPIVDEAGFAYKSYVDNKLNEKENKLTFAYDNDKISAINGSALAGQGGKTYSAGAGISIVDEYISLSADYIQAITQVSGKQDKLEFTYDNSGSIIKINNSAIAGGAGGGSISYTGRNGVTINGNYIELETTAKNAIDSVGGISTDVETLKTASSNWNEVSAKLDSSLASTTYQTKSDMANYLTTGDAASTYQKIGNYATKEDINDMATKTWVEQKNYLTEVPSEYVTDTELQITLGDYATNTLVQNTSANITALIPSTAGLASETDLQIVSAGVDYVSAHAITAHQSLTNYYTKSETSGAIELSTEFAKYQPKGNYLVADDITGKLDKSIYANASGNWENTYNVVNQYSAAGTWLTAHQNLDNYYTKTQVDSTFASATQLNNYLTTAKYQTDSATFALKSDLNGLVNSASVTTNDNYVMTNSGWKVLTLSGGGMTQVYHDTTLTGDGNANDNQLGVKWETLSSNTIAYSNSAFNLTNGTSVSSFNQISASIDDRYSKNASDNRYLRKSLDNTLTGDGKDASHKLGVAWSALSGNTIASAEKAGEAQGFRWGDNTYQDTSAALTNLWNAKNHVTLQTANNILTVDNNDNTSATLSAMSYVNNTLNNRAFLPQKACVCLESEITTMATLANGQGMLFFVVSAH